MVHINPPSTYTRLESAGLLTLASRNAINPGDWPENFEGGSRFDKLLLTAIADRSLTWIRARHPVDSAYPVHPSSDYGCAGQLECFCDKCLTAAARLACDRVSLCRTVTAQ